MKIEKEHQTSTLMNKNKKYLVERLMILEHNNNILHDTIDAQADNYKKLLNENSEKVNTITTEMMEHICDNLCKHPAEAAGQEELEDICTECRMGKFICDILNIPNDDVKDA